MEYGEAIWEEMGTEKTGNTRKHFPPRIRPRKAASFCTRGEALGRKERGTRNLPLGRLRRPAQLLCGNKEKSRKRTWVERKGKWQKLLSLFRRRGRHSSYKKTS